jgi:hypothetical protein
MGTDDPQTGTQAQEGQTGNSGPETRIADVEAIPFNLPYRKPLGMASSALIEATHVLVRVRTEGGLMGQAEAPVRPMI